MAGNTSSELVEDKLVSPSENIIYILIYHHGCHRLTNVNFVNYCRSNSPHPILLACVMFPIMLATFLIKTRGAPIYRRYAYYQNR